MSGLWCLREEIIEGQNREVIKRGLKIYLWSFPGGPVVKILPFNTAGYKFDPCQGAQIHMTHSQKTKTQTDTALQQIQF